MSLLSSLLTAFEVTQSPLSLLVKVCLRLWMGVKGRKLKRSDVKKRASKQVPEQIKANNLFFIKYTQGESC